MPLYVLCFVKNLWNGFLLIKPQSCHCTKSLSHHNIHSRWIRSWEHFEPLRMSNKKTFPGVKHYPIITLLTNETDSNWFVIIIPSLVFWRSLLFVLNWKTLLIKRKLLLLYVEISVKTESNNIARLLHLGGKSESVKPKLLFIDAFQVAQLTFRKRVIQP